MGRPRRDHAMSFFSRLSKPPVPSAASAPQMERRATPRFFVGPDFPLKASLSYIGRDDTGAPMSSSRAGWNWKGQLVELSEAGARMNMGQAMKTAVGEPCDLTLFGPEFEVKVSSTVANIREEKDGVVFGLRHEFTDQAAAQTYRRLLETVALASTLRLESRADQPDASGYLLENFASGPAVRLTLWRNPKGKSVDAFQLLFNENLLRAYAGQNLEFVAYDGSDWTPAPGDKCVEMLQQFQWAATCLSADVPDDARAFLKQFTA
jgi:hypothetical protein